MNRLLTRPISKKAVLNERPTSASHLGQVRMTRGSQVFSSGSYSLPVQVQHNPEVQDMGTSTSPLKFDDFEASPVPIQTLTFKSSKVSAPERHRRVLIVKYLRSEPSKSSNSRKSSERRSSRSLLKYFDMMNKPDQSFNPGSRGSASSRPVTCRSSGPVNKRVFSELNLDYPAGSRMFDICEVLSVAQGEFNMRYLRGKR
jgi:hypothetical protein